MMKLYTFPWSSNARKAVMTAELLGSEVEHVNVNLGKGEQRNPEFLAMSPSGRVPVLVDDGFVLSESNAIMMYLADKKPGNTLLPAATKERYDVIRWLFWQANHWSPAMGALNFENMLKKRFGGGEPDAAHVKRSEDSVRQLGTLLDNHLEKHEWLSGSNLTIADIGIAVPLMYTVPSKIPVEGFAHVQRWYSQIKSLDAWKKSEPPPMPAA